MEQIIEVVGAVLVLSGFILSQSGRLTTRSRTYLSLNLVGAGILAFLALSHGQPGFLLLEGAWAIVAAVGLARSLLA